MNNHFQNFILLFFSLSLAVACSPPSPLMKSLTEQKSFDQITNKEEYIANMFTGYFSNEEQALLNKGPLYSNQRYVGRRIWPNRKKEYWIAGFKFNPAFIEAPLGQVIFNVKRLNRDTIMLISYGYKERKKYGLEWQKEEPFADLTPKDLMRAEGCVSYLTTADRKTYNMVGSDLLCPLNLSSAMAYIRLDAKITKDYIAYGTRFYNTSKKFTVSYEKDALMFKRVAIANIPKNLK